VSGFAAGLEIGFDSDFGATDSLDFNDFDAGLWDSWVKAALAALADFFATGLPALAAGVLTAAFGPARAAFAVVAFWADDLEDDFTGLVADFLADPLEDFLRVFLDIRLPFVAFGGSTNRVLRVTSRPIGFAPAAGQV